MTFANKRGWKFSSENCYVTVVVFSGYSKGKLIAEALLLLVWTVVL
jgi:hypothetical protein